MTRIPAAVERARNAAGLSQRQLADRTDISQSTLSRIIDGSRTAKMPELIAIAEATGYTLDQLTNRSVEGRVEVAARATNGASMGAMRARLVAFAQLSAYLDDQAIFDR